LKTDDDVFVNVPNLIHILLGGTIPLYRVIYEHIKIVKNYAKLKESRVSEDSLLLLGNLAHHTKIMNSSSNKWFVPHYIFSGDIYPEYLRGAGYVFTYEVAEMLYTESLTTPLFPYEDVYMIGFVAERTDLKPINHPLFKNDENCDRCSMRGFVLQHPMSVKYTVEDFQFYVKNTSHRCDLV
jgi:beta-1,3-galactosyltransferase 1